VAGNVPLILARQGMPSSFLALFCPPVWRTVFWVPQKSAPPDCVRLSADIDRPSEQGGRNAPFGLGGGEEPELAALAVWRGPSVGVASRGNHSLPHRQLRQRRKQIRKTIKNLNLLRPLRKTLYLPRNSAVYSCQCRIRSGVTRKHRAFGFLLKGRNV